MAKGLFYIATAAAAWGTGGVVAVLLYQSSGLGPIAVSFWRFIFGVAVLLALRPWRSRVRVDWRLAALTGAGLAVFQTAYFGSVQQAGVSIGTVVTLAAGPVLMALGGAYFLRERVTATVATALGVALVGLVLLMWTPGPVGPNLGLGIALALLSAAGYSAVTLYRRGRDAGHDPATLLAALAIGAVCLLPLAFVEGILPYTSGLPVTAAWLLYLGAIPTVVAYRLFFSGLSTVPATTAAIVALIEPLTAAAIAMVALGERLTASGFAGGALLLAAVALLALRARPASSAAAPSAPVSSAAAAPAAAPSMAGLGGPGADGADAGQTSALKARP